MQGKFSAIWRGLKGSNEPWCDGRVVQPSAPDETAFEHAALAVDRTVGAIQQVALFWRAGCFVFAATTALTSAGWFWQAQQSTVEPIAITFDQAGKAGEVFIPANYTPSDANKFAFIDHWVLSAWPKTGNKAVDAQRREFLAASTSGQASQDYVSWFNASNADKERQVRVVAIKPTADHWVLNVTWDERRGGNDGQWLRFTGDFTIVYKRQETREEVYANKYGLHVVKYTRVPVNELVSK